MTFLVAGHETTATSMIWAIYLLCKHKDIQSKLRQEIRAKIPSLAHDITPSDIDDCSYLQAFCSEVLRLWAPVSLTMRVAAKDTVIAQQVIPKGTTIILAPWAINTSEALWGSDASEFRPERWLNDDGRANQNGHAKSNYSFLSKFTVQCFVKPLIWGLGNEFTSVLDHLRRPIAKMLMER